MSPVKLRSAVYPSNKLLNQKGTLIMKLADRVTPNEPSASTQPSSDSIDQLKIKLFYRGNTFDYIPPPVMISEEDETDLPTVTLIYRGNTFVRRLHPPKPYQKPRAINWRWQFE
jgi:hypothetical protein